MLCLAAHRGQLCRVRPDQLHSDHQGMSRRSRPGQGEVGQRGRETQPADRATRLGPSQAPASLARCPSSRARFHAPARRRRSSGPVDSRRPHDRGSLCSCDALLIAARVSGTDIGRWTDFALLLILPLWVLDRRHQRALQRRRATTRSQHARRRDPRLHDRRGRDVDRPGRFVSERVRRVRRSMRPSSSAPRRSFSCLGGRASARSIVRRRSSYLQNTIIIGAGDVGQLVGRKMVQHPEFGINLVGFVDSEPKQMRTDLSSIPLLGAARGHRRPRTAVQRRAGRRRILERPPRPARRPRSFSPNPRRADRSRASTLRGGRPGRRDACCRGTAARRPSLEPRVARRTREPSAQSTWWWEPCC